MAREGGSKDAIHRTWVAVGERVRGKLQRQVRDEFLDREVFHTLLEARVLTKQYRQTSNRIRQHSSLGYRPPTPDTILPENLVPVLVGLT